MKPSSEQRRRTGAARLQAPRVPFCVDPVATCAYCLGSRSHALAVLQDDVLIGREGTGRRTLGGLPYLVVKGGSKHIHLGVLCGGLFFAQGAIAKRFTPLRGL